MLQFCKSSQHFNNTYKSFDSTNSCLKHKCKTQTIKHFFPLVLEDIDKNSKVIIDVMEHMSVTQLKIEKCHNKAHK
jgi:hypothetical protein